jgi:ABC-type transport system involved in multi-copper enzyme maturation permease subunit
VITIARLTIGEAARKRVLWVLAILAVVAVLLTAFLVNLLVSGARQSGVDELTLKLGVSQVLIFIAFVFTFILAMTAAFLGSPAISSDLDSGIAQSLLARPLRRSSYLVGRWLGLTIVVVAYAAGSALLAIAAVAFVSGYTPPNVLLPVAYLAFQAVILLTLAVFVSTRLAPIAGGAVAVVAYGLAWLLGVVGDIGAALGATGLQFISDVGRFLMPTDGLWRGVVYGLEPAIVISAIGNQPIARANPFFATQPPELGFVIWSFVWIVLVLLLSINELRRREL